MRKHFVAMCLLAMAMAMPVTAQVVNPLDLTTDPADRAVMAEASAAIAEQQHGIAALDRVLAKLSRPTPLRGMVQTVRAATLWSEHKTGPAVAAIEEGLRLLPDDPRPKMVATGIFIFSGSPARAADLWLQASRESPEIAATLDRYLVMALIGRLREIDDTTRADRITARLGEIGYSAGLASERSSAAMARLRESVRDGRTAEAIQAVSAIGDPDDLLTLYIDKRYEALWPRIAEWAGADLTAQSGRYLAELRADWTATDSFDAAAAYARELAAHRAYDVVVGLFLPRFASTDGKDTDGAPFLAAVVARSLVRLGRPAEALSLLAKVATERASEDTPAMALNIDGAYLTLATMNVDWPQVIHRADAFVATARVQDGEVNRKAMLNVLSWRACALSRTGKADAAERDIAEVLLAKSIVPAVAMQMLLCRGNEAAARAHLLASFDDEKTRSWALRFVQPRVIETGLALDRLVNPVREAVRTAPDVVAAARKVGRILREAVDPGMPKDFDPFRVPTAPRSAGADAI